MVAFEIEQLHQQHTAVGELYLEFLRQPSMSLGLYLLPVGSADPQQPHAEDEVYFVLHGRALINVAGEDRPVQSGSLIFVGKQVPHHFHTITEELHVLVFFAPAESA